MTLIFARQPTFWSWWIRFVTRSEWSHVAIHTPDKGRYDGIAEATSPLGVAWHYRTGFNTRYPDQLLVEIPAPDDNAGFEWLGSCLTKPYDRTALWSFLLPWIKPTPGAYYCASLAAGALRAAGVPNVPTGRVWFNQLLALAPKETP